jgi:proteasome lid subunit RPN8/RPN11
MRLLSQPERNPFSRYLRGANHFISSIQEATLMIHCSPRIKTRIAALLWDDQIERVACLIGSIEGDDFIVSDVLPARNEDYKPAEEFYISGQQMSRLASEAQRRGYLLIGVAHSHLPHHPAVPSEADIRYCRHPVNVMIHPASQTLSWFNASGELWRETAAAPQRRPSAPTPVFAFG